MTKVAGGHAPSSRGKYPALVTTLKIIWPFWCAVHLPLSFLNVGLHSLKGRRLKSSPTLSRDPGGLDLSTIYVLHITVALNSWKLFVFHYVSRKKKNLIGIHMNIHSISFRWFTKPNSQLLATQCLIYLFVCHKETTKIWSFCH